MPSATETDPDRAGRVAAGPRSDGDGDAALPAIDPDAYELLGELARGGMGRILRARDRRLGRQVAIKQLIDPTPHASALFEREVRITARLQHPSIVSLLEAGVLPNGERMFVMKLVSGRPLRDVLRDPLAVRERLGLLPIAIAIADALAYAHEQGVIHRDLKPSNVLVGAFGEVVVIDWGLAHDDGDRAAPDPASPATITARAMGTPAYMAPEAARGEPVDERADVYAIGAILYETLAGAPPYRGDDGASILQAVRAGSPEPIARRVAGTPADLAAIVDKAMAHDRSARYPTARELAEELRRFATGQLVSAHAYSLGDRARRWLRRHRAPVAVAAAAGVLVISLTGIGVSRIVHERDLAADRAEQLTLAQARLELDRDPAAALGTLTALPAGSALWSAARTIAADAVARGVPRHLASDARIDAIAISRGRPRIAIVRDDAIEVGATRIAGRASVVALSADGEVLAALGDGRVRAWRLATPPALVLDRPGPRVAPALAVSGDGAAIAAAGRDFGVASWRVADGAERVRDAQARLVEQLAVARDGAVITGGAGQLTVLAVGVPPQSHAGAPVALAAAGELAVAATADGELRLLASASQVARIRTSASALAASPDGALVALAGEAGIAVIDRSGRTVRAIATRRRGRAVAIDDRGAVAIADGAEVWWWDAPDPERTHVAGSPAPAIAIAVARERVVTAAEDGSVWAWRDGKLARLGAHTAPVRALAISPDARYAVTTGDDRTVRRWSLDGAGDAILGIHQAPGLAVAIAPGGQLVASGGADRAVRVWRAGGGSAVLGQHAGRVRALAFAPDGRHLASIADDPVALVWPTAGGPARALPHDAPVTAIAWLGDAVVTGTRDGAVRLWPAAGLSAQVLVRHGGAVRALAVAGLRVGSAGDDGRVALGDASGMRLHRGHDDLVRRVAFSPDASTLASASEDGTVRIWDAVTGESRAIGFGHWVSDVAFAHDGATVIAAGADGGLWLIPDRLPHDRRALRGAIASLLEAAR